MNIKKYIIYFSCLLLFILLVFNTTICLEAAKEGISLWINVVFPSLFPFFIASSMLISSGAANSFGKILAPITNKLFKASGESGYIMATSMLSGYPMGPRLCSQMYSKGYLTADQVEHFLSFVNTSGPSFIIGAVASGMLKNVQLGTYLALSHYLGTILTGMLFSIKRQNSVSKSYSNENIVMPPFGNMLSEAVNKAMQTQLIIGGFIILFSVIINLLLHLNIIQGIAGVFSHLGVSSDPEVLSGTLAGIFEITNSCSLLSQTSASLNTLLPIISAVISFSGFSILMQSYTLLSNANIRFKALLLPKIVHAVISYVLCYVAILIFPLSVTASNIDFSYSYSFIDTLINSVSFSIIHVAAVLIIILSYKIIHHSKKPA